MFINYTLFFYYQRLPIHRFKGNHCLFVCLFLFFTNQYSFSQTADFSFTPVNGNFCAPTPIKFQATFSETPVSFYWQFGIPGEESDQPEPTYIYSIPGSYTVKLIVLYENTIYETQKNIGIFGSPNIVIKPNANYLCKPGIINFELASNVSLSRVFWDFGDNQKDTTIGENDTSHTYLGFGNFNIVVNSTDIRGCKGVAESNVTIQKPPAILFDSGANGCSPINVFFSAKVSLPAGSSINSYVWNFGDGGPLVTTNTDNISHLYTIPNSYTTTLEITTSDGCSNSYKFQNINVGVEPTQTSIMVLKDTICSSEEAIFTATSTGAKGFLWEISNGTSINTNSNKLVYKFNSLGTFRVKVTPVNNGCKGTADSLSIVVRGVIANFRGVNTCSNRNRFEFRYTGSGNPNNYKWFFADTLLGSTSVRPVHQFPVQGVFPVTLIAGNNISGCFDTARVNIFTGQPKIQNPDTFACIGNSVTMRIADTYPNARTLYTWVVGGNNLTGIRDSIITHKITSPGIFTNSVVISNGQGYCNDTLFQNTSFRVAGPSVSISFDSSICFSDTLFFENHTTTAFSIDPVVEWIWNFGDGSTSNMETPLPYVYKMNGLFQVSLKAKDGNGCVDSTMQQLRVNRLPILKILSPDGLVCPGKDVSLEALHTSPVFWSPSNLFNCDTCSTVIVNPIAFTSYNAMAVDTFGCKTNQSFSIDVWPDYSLPPNLLRDTGICIGNSVQFDLQLNDKIISWAPVTGLSAINIANPLATPQVTTTYTATISDSAGCFVKSLSSVVEVYPLPEIDMGPDLYMPFNTPFTIRPTYSSDIVSYNWQPAGLLSCNNCPEPSGVALETNTFFVTTTTDKGCKDSASILVSIECTEDNLMMPSAFTPNNDGLNDFFYPITKGKPTVTRFLIYNRFGELVFQRYNFEPNIRTLGWDGTYKGKVQPSGSFIFIIETECYQGASTSKKGSLMLLR